MASSPFCSLLGASIYDVRADKEEWSGGVKKYILQMWGGVESWIYFAVRGVEVGSNSNINCGRPTWMPMHSLAAASSLDDDDIWIRRLFHLILSSVRVRPSVLPTGPSLRALCSHLWAFIRVSL